MSARSGWVFSRRRICDFKNVFAESLPVLPQSLGFESVCPDGYKTAQDTSINISPPTTVGHCDSVPDDYATVEPEDCYMVSVFTRERGDPTPAPTAEPTVNCTLPMSDSRMLELMQLAYNRRDIGE